MGRFRNIMSKETILFRGGMEIIKQATNSKLLDFCEMIIV